MQWKEMISRILKEAVDKPRVGQLFSGEMVERAGIRSLTLTLIVMAFTHFQASGDPAFVPQKIHDVKYESGTRANFAENDAVVWSQQIDIPDAPWVRLLFDSAHLEGNSYLRITSIKDGNFQILNSQTVAEWQNSTAYFNGSAVRLDLIAAARTNTSLVSIKQVIAGDLKSTTKPLSNMNVCTINDSRELSSNPAVARLLEAIPGANVCTGFIIDRAPFCDPANRLMLSAGHCFSLGPPQAATVIEFDVPPSDTFCVISYAPPNKQFAIDRNSVFSLNYGVGSAIDFAVFLCFRNSNTGKTVFEERQAAFPIASAVFVDSAELFGYGSDGDPLESDSDSIHCTCRIGNDEATKNHIQQVAHGRITDVVGDTLLRHDISVCGGGSGGPIVNKNGEVAGIHTTGQCSFFPSAHRHNAGTAITLPVLQGAIYARSNLFCGDMNQDLILSPVDIVLLFNYINNFPTNPPFCTANADIDDYAGITIRDLVVLNHLVFLGEGMPLTCPPTQSKYLPTFDPANNLEFENTFPAGDTSMVLHLNFTNAVPLHGLMLPIKIRVGGAVPKVDTVIISSRFGSPLFGLRKATINNSDGTVLFGFAGTGLDTLLPGTGEMATIKILLPGSGINRPINISFANLPPNNYPMIVEPNLTAWEPALNGGYGGPNLNFYALPRTGNPPLAVFFSGLAPDSMESWIWSFGDGDSAFIQNPVHIYQDTGKFTVTLEAIRLATSYKITRTAYIRVNSINANFVGTPLAGAPPLSVSFTDLTTGAPTSWFWNFGDGNFAFSQNPMHTYSDTGWFDVTLVASNPANSDTAKFLHYIRVDSTPDLMVTAYGNTRPRPGFDKCYYILVKNQGRGTPTISTLQLVLPPQTNYLHSTPFGTLAGNTVSWDVPPLAPGAQPLQYQVCVNVPSSVAGGTLLRATASVDPAPSEVNLANNVHVDNETVVTSIDPNDKAVQPIGCGSQSAIRGDERLTYTIFFENKASATAEAIYVLIVDTLDPNLDWGTLQIGPTSHDSVLSFNFDPFSGAMTWFFDSINLPPNVNPPQGEGFVSYTISPKSGLPSGTIIPNRAYIRFDYNDWLAAPDSGSVSVTVLPTAATKGDLNADGILTSTDVVLILNCVFLGTGNCNNCIADVNCDGVLTSPDVVLELNKVFLGTPFPCQ